MINDSELIQPDTFTQQSWFDYAQTVFSTKFLFDIFGDLSSENFADDCPTYTFFDRDFELCPIKDLIVIMKYPTIISFILWSYQNI